VVASGDRPRIVFAGTPAFAVPCLDALVAADHLPVAVYTQPDRPAGRGRKLGASEVKRRAEAKSCPVYQPLTLRDPEALDEFAALTPDLMVVVAYGLILPPEVLAVPTQGCVNLHASLLPHWRGAAPIQRAVMAGDTRTGVSLMAMTEGLDEGPVYAYSETPIDGTESAAVLHDRLAVMGAALLIEWLPAVLDGTAVAVAQEATAATYAAKVSKREAELDWSRPATDLVRQVLGLDPSPVAWTAGPEGPIRIWSASATDPSGPAEVSAGTVVAEDESGIRVATGAGDLLIHRLQLPGSRALDAAAFLHGRSLLGRRLGDGA
jgi:methionyl-tRNA formyltransferase